MITIFKNSMGWHADFTKAENSHELARVMGTAILPLPFTSRAKLVDVLADVQARNPLEMVCSR